MNFEQFRYVSEIARCGSFSGAAAALYVSQPTLSATVKKLENTLGEQIFIRHSTGVSLSPYGETILPYIRDVLATIDQMPQQIYGKNSRGRPRLSVANGAYKFMIEPLSRVYEKYREDGVFINFYDVSREVALDMVASSAAQVGGYSIYDFQKERLERLLKSKHVHFEKLCTATPTVSLGPKNPLFNREENWVTLDMVRHFPLIYNYTEHSDALYRRLGLLSSGNIITCSEREGRRELIDNLDCISIGAIAMHPYKRTDFNDKRRVFDLRGVDYSVEIGYITREEEQLPQIAEEFIGYLREIVMCENNG